MATAELREQNRPKRLAAQRAKAYLNDNLDWNEERALQKALEASLVDEAARIQQRHEGSLTSEWSTTDDEKPSEMSSSKTNGHLSNRSQKSHRNRTRQSRRYSKSTIIHQSDNRINKDAPSRPNQTRKLQTKNVRNTKQKNKITINKKNRWKDLKQTSDFDNKLSTGFESDSSYNTENCNEKKISVNDGLDASSPDDDHEDIDNFRIDDSPSISPSNPDADMIQSSHEDESKTVKYLDNVAIRRTVAAQRKFAINSIVFRLANQKLSENEDGQKDKKDVTQDDEALLEHFEFFPNKVIDCHDFITWVCHTDIEDIKWNSLIEFPRTFRFREIFSFDYDAGKYRDVNDTNDELEAIYGPACFLAPDNSLSRSLIFSNTKEELSSHSSDEEKLFEKNEKTKSVVENDIKCTKKIEPKTVLSPNVRSLRNNTNTSPNALTRSKAKLRNMTINEPDDDISEGIKPKNRRAKPVSIVDYLSDDSDENQIKEEEVESEPIQSRITRSNKNKQQQISKELASKNTNKTNRSKMTNVSSKGNNTPELRKWCSSAEEIRKRALQYEADFRQTMKDIESKYHSKRYGQQCDKNINSDHVTKRSQYLSISSSSLDDSDLDDDCDERLMGSSDRNEPGQTNALRTVHSLRRIKTLRKAVLSKTIKNDDNRRSGKRCSTRMSNSSSTNVNGNTFDIRTRASMRRTRNSKFQHQNRNKNNFLFQQYDGRPLASSALVDVTIATSSIIRPWNVIVP